MAKQTPPIPTPYVERMGAVRAVMRAQKLDGYLVFDRMDQLWLTGFTGEDGCVLVTARQVVLLTDGRFDETADIEAPYATKVLRKKRGPETTAKSVKKYRLARVGFDPAHLDVATYTGLRKACAPCKLAATGDVVTKMRKCKSPQELTAIRGAIDIAQRAFIKLQKWAKPGLTEREVAAKLIYEMQRLGAQGPGFTPIVASGPNASLPHYEPGERKLRRGEPVLVDWGARVDWYVSDLTRMMWIGSIPRQIAKIYDVVREAHDRAIEAVRAGVTGAAVDKVARDIIRRAGYGKQFGHSLGHGIGLNVHEGPSLGRTAVGELEPGMVVTIEPGIYLPGIGGVRLEDDVLVTETGSEVLSNLTLERPN